MILVDSNIWIDVIQEDPVWLDWSLAQLQQARVSNRVVINPIIYAELAPTYDEPEQLDYFLKVAKATLKPLPRQQPPPPAGLSCSTAKSAAPKRACCQTFLLVPTRKQKAGLS